MFNFPRAFSALGVLLLSAGVEAIQIDSMLRVTDEQGKTTFTITNDEEKRLFMTVMMSELTVSEGQIQKVPYNRENLKDWKLDVYPTKTVIDPDFKKDFSVVMRCGDQCDNTRDQAFQLAFVPTPYFDGDQPPQHSIQMAIGFGAVVILPGEEKPLNYRAHYTDSTIQFNNYGDSFINVTLSSCAKTTPTNQRAACTKKVTLLAGRQLSVSLPEKMQVPTLDMQVKTYTAQFKETIQLTRQEP